MLEIRSRSSSYFPHIGDPMCYDEGMSMPGKSGKSKEDRGDKHTEERGPFKASQVNPGDRYELSSGHPVYCVPTGGAGAFSTVAATASVAFDPAAKETGIDPGYSPEPGMLRAPDVAVGNVPNEPGWIAGAPHLAIEHADVGQDEDGLQRKIQDLLKAGTRYLWVVRLVGPRRVEVHEPGKPMREAFPGEELTAPGVLKNPVPVEALYDQSVAQRVALRNLLQREGYEDLDAVLAKGRDEGIELGIGQGIELGIGLGIEKGERQMLLRLLRRRFGDLSPEITARVSAGTSQELERWADQVLVAASVHEVFEPPPQ